jgi:hypothetical protein
VWGAILWPQPYQIVNDATIPVDCFKQLIPVCWILIRVTSVDLLEVFNRVPCMARMASLAEMTFPSSDDNPIPIGDF